MQIKFLPSTKADLRWFKQYYSEVFPEGRAKADQQFRGLLIFLKSQPLVGREEEEHPGFASFLSAGCDVVQKQHWESLLPFRAATHRPE